VVAKLKSCELACVSMCNSITWVLQYLLLSSLVLLLLLLYCNKSEEVLERRHILVEEEQNRTDFISNLCNVYKHWFIQQTTHKKRRSIFCYKIPSI